MLGCSTTTCTIHSILYAMIRWHATQSTLASFGLLCGILRHGQPTRVKWHAMTGLAPDVGGRGNAPAGGTDEDDRMAARKAIEWTYDSDGTPTNTQPAEKRMEDVVASPAAPGTHCSLLTAHYLLPSTYYQHMNTRPTSMFTIYLLPSTNYVLLPTDCFLLTASYFLLPTSCFLLPAYNLLPTTYYLILTTYY